MFIQSVENLNRDSIIYLGEKALHYAKQVKDRDSEIYLLIGLANNYFDISPKTSSEYIQLADELSKSVKSDEVKMHILLNIANYEQRIGHFDNAIKILNELVPMYKARNKSEEYICYEYLSYSYQELGDYYKALEYEILRNTTQNYFESEASRKSILESELKYESEKKDKTIIEKQLLLLKKQHESETWSNLFKIKQTENTILEQTQNIALEKNENLKNQILIDAQRNKLQLAEKELSILNKNQYIKNAILLSICIVILLISAFIYILWKKIKVQQNLEQMLQNTTQKVLQAKQQLEEFTPFVKLNTGKLSSDISEIQKDLEKFEQIPALYFRIFIVE